MAPFIPIACSIAGASIAGAITCALAFETGKGTKKTIKRRQKRNARKKT